MEDGETRKEKGNFFSVKVVVSSSLYFLTLLATSLEISVM